MQPASGTALAPPADATVIKFGTDGWRARIAEDFTFANVRVAARAVSRYLLANEDYSKGILVGYDCRFMSERFAAVAAEEVAACGIPVTLASGFVPTPAVAFAVRSRRAAGAIVITASHNPWQWNGFKFKASYGGSAAPEIVKKIEAELPHSTLRGAAGVRQLATADLVEPYLAHLEKVIDLEAIARRNFLFIADPMYGAARGCLLRLCSRHGIRCEEIHGSANPLFGGLNPEPIEPHVHELSRAVVERKAQAGFATDGDADRVGAIDRDGAFVDSHQIFSILLRYLVEVRGLKGAVVKTFSTAKLVDLLAARYGLPLYETPIGFKYICDRMLSTKVLIGGEESGGIGVPDLGGPERDGVLNALLLAEAMAHYGKTLGELVAELHREFGPHQYGRVDLAVTAQQKEAAMRNAAAARGSSFAGFRVGRTEDLDGVKMYLTGARDRALERTWLLVRASGTEPLLRVYCEAPSKELVQEVLVAAERYILSL